jgi:HlyD family secretion protein
VEAAGQRLQLLERGYRKEEIDAARARREAAEARIAEIEQKIRDAVVTSPAAGVITETLVEEGEILPPGATLAVLTRLDEPWLTAWVGEPDLGRLRLGQTARVTTDGGESRDGKLTWISPRAEFTPKNVQTRDERVKLVYRIKITLGNDDGLFKPGMPAQAHLDAAADGAAAGDAAAGDTTNGGAAKGARP